mmetsp:Transcript_3843/g.4666  ORF Transcript_3843/g.4666 Transcript_3843/m.4666 type:complete len:496 (-) Transcript_3843:1169-2656(-)
MGKAHKKNKMSSSQKRDAFWEALNSQKQKNVRDGLVNTGIEAQTRNEDGLTSIMFAAANGKAKSLDTLLDWYKRRRLLRQKGWINLTDSQGRTALHMAASRGHLECIESLIDFEAKTEWKDKSGKTPRDLAVQFKKTEAVKLIDEMLRESEDEDVDEDGEAYNDGLTSTQRNRMKKKQMQALERRGMKEEEEEEQEEEEEEEKGPNPIWPEVQNIVDSIDNLREIKEISIVRESPDDSVPNCGVDPALWYLRGINRLEMRLASDILTNLDGQGLLRLRNLSILILNRNSLSMLPDEIGQIKELRILEVSHNKLTRLPNSMSNLKKLELLNLDFNMVENLGSLSGMTSLSTIRATNNKLRSFDLSFEDLNRLTSIAVSHNEIEEIPASIGSLQSLTEFEAEGNRIQEIPSTITALKKVKVFKLADNPISDPKVKKLLKKSGALKDLWKYVEKASKSGRGKSKKQESATKTAAEKDAPQDDDGFASDDSFDITMEEL